MRNQRGTSYFAILFAIMGFAFIAKIAVAVWGPYWDDRILDGQIEELLKAAPANMNPADFNKQMNQRLGMNNLHDMKFEETSKVTNTKGLEVAKNYEIRKNFMMNIDLVMKFEKDFDQSTVKTK